MDAMRSVSGRVDELLPLIARSAGDGDEAGQVSDEVVAAMREAGLFSTLAPRAFGGREEGLQAFSRIVQKVSVSTGAGY